MSLDPIHHHILEQRIRMDAQTVIPHHMRSDIERDPRSREADRHRSLSRRDLEPGLDARRRLGRAISRLGQAIQGDRQEVDQLLTLARTTDTTQGR
ncbi:MAG TPA: hypothetical protein VD789_06145 [Thermomicrobiales bacterium]|nr:hypothetical protein [Thermomicrobiales bacterium]